MELHPGSGLFLPDGYAQHIRAVTRDELRAIQPHSTHLSSQTLEAIAYRGGAWSVTGVAGGEVLSLPPPIVVALDGAFSTRDGDHRLFAAYAAGAASVPIVCYDLAKGADLRAVSDWHEEEHFVGPLLQEGFSRAMIASMAGVGAAKPYADIVRDGCAFVRSEGIVGVADLARRRFATKGLVEENYQTAFAQWEQDRPR